ncbi:MAG: hypothetical protein Q9222_004250 [Ikaeria aurantiellina]
MTSGRAGPFTLGKLYGDTTLKLIPAAGTLLPALIPDFEPAYVYALSGCVAISYPDGCPSDQVFTLTTCGNQQDATVRPSEDDKLRRFVALGWVVRESQGVLRKTGHLLVVDMDDRSVRRRSPWIILASEWPTDGEETPAGSFTWSAEKTVIRDDQYTEGVFPGDLNQTSIAAVKPMENSQVVPGNDNMLQLFGEDFHLSLKQYGYTTNPEDGPALARIMEWYEDQDNGEEVCYDEEGEEYMRYNLNTRSYTFPDISTISSHGD